MKTTLERQSFRDLLLGMGFTTKDNYQNIYVYKSEGKKLSFNIEDKKLRFYATPNRHVWVRVERIQDVVQLEREIKSFIKSE